MINILEVDSVILNFNGTTVLNSIYLQSETGKVTGLLGRNGTGKSSLFKIVFGELRPINKSVRINGTPLLKTYRSPKDLRYLPQFRFVPLSLTIKNIFKDFNIDFTDFLTYFPEFETFYKFKLSNLSGGERRIIEIYIILVSESKFCILDEPFSQIMPLHIDTIKRLIIKEKNNKGIIISDHMYNHIIDICDNLYVIKEGKTYLTSNIPDKGIPGYTYME